MYRGDVGSFWLQAEVHHGGKRKRSAGLQENDSRNLTARVFRLTIRLDESYLGNLTGFFNVPGLFGSIPYQSNGYIGVDCADVLVAARRKWVGKEDSKDFNVSMLVNAWPKVARFEMRGGNPSEEIAWGEKVKPGDLIAVRYRPTGSFAHIGALYADSNENGKLDGGDQMIHAGPEALQINFLRQGSFDGDVVILRPPRG